MPVLVAEEWITAPLEVIRKLHEEQVAAGGDGADSRVVEHFTELLQSEQAWAKVPSLNETPLEQLADGCLVRYRAMVQDQFDPELYLKHYTAVNSTTGHQLRCCGMYRDLLDLPPGCTVDEDSPGNVTGDRHTLYCVPIPAQTEWTRSAYGQCSMASCVREEKEQQEDRGGVKRQLEEEGEGEGEGEMEVEEGERGGGPGTKRPREEGAAGGVATRGGSRQPDLNFPLPDETGLPCLLKVYGEGVEAFRVTSAVECVGVLSKHPVLTHFGGEGDGEEEGMVGETAAERSAHCPPPSLVPRLHCILVTSLTHTNPLLPRLLPHPLPGEVYYSKFGGVARSRDLILSLLTSALLGDRLAAEFSLLHLLSSVHGRREVMAVGKFALNLTHCPSTTPPPPPPPLPSPPSLPSSLHTLISQLLTQSLLLPLSLSVMNAWRLSPRKDYSANRLQAGALQLVSGTHLLLDETALEPGQLSEVGVRNLAALGHVIQRQTVTYDFQYHTTEFECDLPVMVLTEGKKSILKVDCVLPLSPSSSSSPSSPTPSEQQLNEARVYLSLHRMLKYRLPPDVQKLVEEDFVAMRKTDQSMTADKFHHLLCLARLVCLSYGCSELSLSHWNHAKQLETQRLARLQTSSS